MFFQMFQPVKLKLKRWVAVVHFDPCQTAFNE
jgi:hypothetical protein